MSKELPFWATRVKCNNAAKALGASLQAVPKRACGRSLGQGLDSLPSKEVLLAYTQRAADLRSELGIPISFNFDILGGGRQLPDYDRDRPLSCGAGLWGVAITHGGEVFPCGFAIETGNRRFFLGKLEEEGDLLDLWLHSPGLEDWRYTEKCEQCQACGFYGSTCWGGCKVHAYRMTGSLSALDPYCFELES